MNKPSAGITVLMMTGKNFIGMTRLCLLSIANNWLSIPKLTIYSDGSMGFAEIKKALNFWPGELDVLAWKDTVAYHSELKRYALITYGEAHPFGKKLAIILHQAETQPLLWIDSDVLFFKDFMPYVPQNINGFAFGGSQDYVTAYHNTVLKKINLKFDQTYSFNAGILYASGKGVYEDFDLESLLRNIHPDYDFLTEQTIFACIASKSLGILWPLNVIRSFNSDNQQIKAMPVQNVIARHYTSNVRHLFWRDAFYNIGYN